MKKRHWTQEEIDYLEVSWGTVSLSGICKKLNRTENSVKVKAYKLGLGDPIKSFDGVSINELAKTIKVNYSIMKNWEERYGLPVIHKRFTSEKKVKVIKYKDWWKWAEANKQMIDFSRFEKGDLGPEPNWVDEKRRADYRKKMYVPKPHNAPWSSREDNLLKHMVEKGYTYPEICDQLQRTHGAIKRRLQDVGIKYRPVYLDNHRPYTQKEIDYILESVEKGISFQEMARHLKRSEAGIRGKLERMGYKFRNGVPYIIEEKQIS